MTLLALFLSPQAGTRLQTRTEAARKLRGMGFVGARLYVVGCSVAWLYLRLEGPAWQQVLQQWRPWFVHLTMRRWRPGDSLRYALQTLWIVFVSPPHEKPSPPRNRRIVPRIHTRCRLIGQQLAARIQRPEHPAALRLRRRMLELANGGRPWMLALAALLILPPLLLVTTQPFSLTAQIIFVAVLWLLALAVRRLPSHFFTLMLIVLSVLVSARYIWWRYTSTLNLDNPSDAFFGIVLLMAETYSWFVLLLGYVQTARPLKRPVAPMPGDPDTWPTVDVFIPTYNEDLRVVRPTVYAALGLDWPHEKLRIHLLDDGRREDFKVFAREAGINYITRTDNRKAKAGNLNNALAQTDGEFVAIFDCDHIPTRSFLQLTAGWLINDPRMALVQTPHHFFSPDPFERNLGHFRKTPNEGALFYGLVQDGNDLWNSAFFCGSCAIMRRTALESIGGIATDTVTEDAHTALRLHRNGWRSAYIRVPQAAGLATESLSAHIGQRIRWARGMAQIFRLDNPLFGRGLSLWQRLCYTNAMLHFLAGLPRLVYLTIPLAFLIFHSYILYTTTIAIVLYVLPHLAHATITNSRMQGSYRRTFWGEVYETVLAWYIARPTTIALFAPHLGNFNVTAKGGLIKKEYFDWKISHPFVLLALANIIGMLFGAWRLVAGPEHEQFAVGLAMLWTFYNLTILGCAIAVAAETRQVREAHRVPSALPALVRLKNGHTCPATLADFSECGAALVLAAPLELTSDTSLQLILMRGNRQHAFPIRVMRSSGSNIGVRFDPLSQREQIDLVQCTFARADSWLVDQHKVEADRPMQSLAEVMKTSWRGYRRLAQHLPFPLNLLVQFGTSVVGWIASLLPVHQPRSNSPPG